MGKLTQPQRGRVAGRKFLLVVPILQVIHNIERGNPKMEQFFGYHARALRAIGQDLADLLPDSMTIEPDGDSFIVHGICNRARLENQQSNGGWNGLRKISAKLRAGIMRPPMGEPDLDLTPFTRSYQAADIERLDAHGNQRRYGPGGLPEIYSLAERLRTIGKVIDGHNGRLGKIFKDLHHIIFEYRDGDDKLRKVELDNTQLYRLQRRYTGERSDNMAIEFNDESGPLEKTT